MPLKLTFLFNLFFIYAFIFRLQVKSLYVCILTPSVHLFKIKLFKYSESVGETVPTVDATGRIAVLTATIVNTSGQ